MDNELSVRRIVENESRDWPSTSLRLDSPLWLSLQSVLSIRQIRGCTGYASNYFLVFDPASCEDTLAKTNGVAATTVGHIIL